jgi:hypothetical protein
MTFKNTRKAHMRRSGQSLVEATCGLVVITAIVTALVDLAIVIYGVSLNQWVCRNAASAAAAGNVSEAECRAKAAIDHSSGIGLGTVISRSKLILPVEVNLTSEPMARWNPETEKMSNPGGMVTGTITVETQVEIKPIAMGFIFRRSEALIFRSFQSFPIHYIAPAS